MAGHRQIAAMFGGTVYHLVVIAFARNSSHTNMMGFNIRVLTMAFYGFQVAVDDPLFVRRRQPIRDLDPILDRLCWGRAEVERGRRGTGPSSASGSAFIHSFPETIS
jgi:hypothetical protein